MIVATCVMTLPVQASSTSITVFPSIISFSLSPGATSSIVLTIGNNSDTPLPVRLVFEPLILAEESTALPTIGSWITLSKDSFLIPGNTQEKTIIKINLPKTIPIGGYYGMLYVEPLVSQQIANSSYVMTKMGVLILGSVGVQDVPFNTIELQQPHLTTIISESNILHISYEVKNNALNHITAKPYLVIHPLFGKTETIIMEEHLVFPGKKRKWEGTFIVKDSGKIFYKADLYVSIGNGLSHKKSFSFGIFPATRALVLILCIGSIFIVLRKRKQIKKALRIIVKG